MIPRKGRHEARPAARCGWLRDQLDELGDGSRRPWRAAIHARLFPSSLSLSNSACRMKMDDKDPSEK